MMNFTANLAALFNEFAAYLNKNQMHGGCEETIMARNENHTALFEKFAGFLAETDCVPREEMSGHYICYVKNSQGNWFKIDGSSVEPVELKRVSSEGAYMLLYARRSPRPPALLGSNALSHAGTSNRRNSEAVPSSLSKSKLRYMVPSMNSSAGQPKSSRDRYRMNFDGSSNQSLDPDDWRSHSMYRAPATDSSRESSSIFSSPVASSCSTVSTKDSSSNEDFFDYIFGQVGTNPYSQFRRSSDVVTPSLFPNFDVDMKGPTEDSEGGGNSTILYTDRGRHRRKSTSD